MIDTLRAGDQAAGQGLKVQVGGFQAVSLDFNRYLYSNFPKTIAFILIATYILLLFMFRSVVLPLKAILMNVLSVCASYGVLVFIFQWGNFSNILNFTPDGFLNSILPILLFCILFGLSMDYEVFLLSRIREEWLLTHNNRWSVARGLAKTGGVITNAALALRNRVWRLHVYLSPCDERDGSGYGDSCSGRCYDHPNAARASYDALAW